MSRAQVPVYLPVLIGGVCDGETLIVAPGQLDHVVERHGKAPHRYVWRSYDLRPSPTGTGNVNAARSGVTWPKIGAFVHEDTDERAAARRVLEELCRATGMEPRA